MAAASVKTSPVPVSGPPCGPLRVKLGEMKIRFEPRLVIWLAMAEAVPLLTAIMMMTAATPMMMPSMVSSERTLFLPIASQEMRNTSPMFMLPHFPRWRVLSIVNHSINMPIFQMDDPFRILGNHRVVRHNDDGGALIMEL